MHSSKDCFPPMLYNMKRLFCVRMIDLSNNNRRKKLFKNKNNGGIILPAKCAAFLPQPNIAGSSCSWRVLCCGELCKLLFVTINILIWLVAHNQLIVDLISSGVLAGSIVVYRYSYACVNDWVVWWKECLLSIFFWKSLAVINFEYTIHQWLRKSNLFKSAQKELILWDIYNLKRSKSQFFCSRAELHGYDEF